MHYPVSTAPHHRMSVPLPMHKPPARRIHGVSSFGSWSIMHKADVGVVAITISAPAKRRCTAYKPVDRQRIEATKELADVFSTYPPMQCVRSRRSKEVGTLRWSIT
ncbi:hypothetical protein K443DRAFT_464076 [Laccaria amethystina LaAM-08-1]|uniref:Uncharacterized protein n=1 Tax=Laccaria amethystina LaAM-08-1 TaxID=1095629 RepID=A0A0C9WNI2_9AGAR|nr:hypothetical protein K443DRAFT_464076 [Laccaria amethystina LaAM-08-1]